MRKLVVALWIVSAVLSGPVRPVFAQEDCFSSEDRERSEMEMILASGARPEHAIKLAREKDQKRKANCGIQDSLPTRSNSSDEVIELFDKLWNRLKDAWVGTLGSLAITSRAVKPLENTPGTPGTMEENPNTSARAYKADSNFTQTYEPRGNLG